MSKKHPQTAADLIGSASKVCRIVLKTGARVKSGEDSETPAWLMYGAPGIAKTAIAVILGSLFSGDSINSIYDGQPYATDMKSGKDVNLETVRQWMNTRTGSLFGDWQVRIIEELDCVPRDAQDLLLHYLDRLPPKTAFIGTSNLNLDLLQERFQTRLRTWKVEAPGTAELAAFLLRERPGLDERTAAQIAVGSGGNVRAALLDAQNVLDAAEEIAA